MKTFQEISNQLNRVHRNLVKEATLLETKQLFQITNSSNSKIGLLDARLIAAETPNTAALQLTAAFRSAQDDANSRLESAKNVEIFEKREAIEELEEDVASALLKKTNQIKKYMTHAKLIVKEAVQRHSESITSELLQCNEERVVLKDEFEILQQIEEILEKLNEGSQIDGTTIATTSKSSFEELRAKLKLGDQYEKSFEEAMAFSRTFKEEIIAQTLSFEGVTAAQLNTPETKNKIADELRRELKIVLPAILEITSIQDRDSERKAAMLLQLNQDSSTVSTASTGGNDGTSPSKLSFAVDIKYEIIVPKGKEADQYQERINDVMNEKKKDGIQKNSITQVVAEAANIKETDITMSANEVEIKIVEKEVEDVGVDVTNSKEIASFEPEEKLTSNNEVVEHSKKLLEKSSNVVAAPVTPVPPSVPPVPSVLPPVPLITPVTSEKNVDSSEDVKSANKIAPVAPLIPTITPAITPVITPVITPEITSATSEQKIKSSPEDANASPETVTSSPETVKSSPETVKSSRCPSIPSIDDPRNKLIEELNSQIDEKFEVLQENNPLNLITQILEDLPDKTDGDEDDIQPVTISEFVPSTDFLDPIINMVNDVNDKVKNMIDDLRGKISLEQIVKKINEQSAQFASLSSILNKASASNMGKQVAGGVKCPEKHVLSQVEKLLELGLQTNQLPEKMKVIDLEKIKSSIEKRVLQLLVGSDSNTKSTEPPFDLIGFVKGALKELLQQVALGINEVIENYLGIELKKSALLITFRANLAVLKW